MSKNLQELIDSIGTDTIKYRVNCNGNIILEKNRWSIEQKENGKFEACRKFANEEYECEIVNTLLEAFQRAKYMDENYS